MWLVPNANEWRETSDGAGNLVRCHPLLPGLKAVKLVKADPFLMFSHPDARETEVQ